MSDPVLSGGENQLGLTFHHLGLAVPDPDAAGLFLTAQGYARGKTVFDPLQSANLSMWTHPVAPDIEVICPARAGEGAVAAILDVRPDGLVYHLCYTTPDMDACLDRIEEAGLRPFEVRDPRPAVLFGGERVAFYLILGFGLIEIIEGSGNIPA
jgi:catechol 2,3-dioxygenase-like lactoylglutathione lyase family enzyme